MDITNTIGYFVAKDMLPISTTNGIGFKRLLRVLEPRYAVPHHKTFAKKTLPAMYTNLKIIASGHLFPLLTVLHLLLIAGPVEPVRLLLASPFILLLRIFSGNLLC